LELILVLRPPGLTRRPLAVLPRAAKVAGGEHNGPRRVCGPKPLAEAHRSLGPGERTARRHMAGVVVGRK